MYGDSSYGYAVMVDHLTSGGPVHVGLHRFS